jgi:hypothetical protein
MWWIILWVICLVIYVGTIVVLVNIWSRTITTDSDLDLDLDESEKPFYSGE